MISNVLLAIGLICLILAICAFVGLLSLPATTLLVIAIICLVAGYVLRGRAGSAL